MNLPDEQVVMMKELNNTGPVQAAMEASNWEWLAGWVSARFGVPVTGEWVRVTVAAHAGVHNPDRREFPDQMWWSDGSWAMWLKTQLIKQGRVPGAGCRASGYEAFYNELHTGFVCIPEDPDMLARLFGDRNPADAGTLARRLRTPAIARTLTMPDPIDRTAARVTGFPRTEG